MKHIKKLISLILTIAMLSTIMVPCFAAPKSTAEDALTILQEMYPDSKIVVDENNIIHVLVTNPVSMAATSSQIYAPRGGRYHSFIRPPLTDLNTYAPLSIVFLPHKEVDAISIAIIRKDVFEAVVSLLSGGKEVGDIISFVAAQFGVVLTPEAVTLFGVIKLYSFLAAIDIVMFNEARAKYDKLCIQQLTLKGNVANIYLEWSGNYVSEAPYEGWNPTFTAGDYTFW